MSDLTSGNRDVKTAKSIVARYKKMIAFERQCNAELGKRNRENKAKVADLEHRLHAVHELVHQEQSKLLSNQDSNAELEHFLRTIAQLSSLSQPSDDHHNNNHSITAQDPSSPHLNKDVITTRRSSIIDGAKLRRSMEEVSFVDSKFPVNTQQATLPLFEHFLVIGCPREVQLQLADKPSTTNSNNDAKFSDRVLSSMKQLFAPQRINRTISGNAKIIAPLLTAPEASAMVTSTDNNAEDAVVLAAALVPQQPAAPAAVAATDSTISPLPPSPLLRSESTSEDNNTNVDGIQKMLLSGAGVSSKVASSLWASTSSAASLSLNRFSGSVLSGVSKVKVVSSSFVASPLKSGGHQQQPSPSSQQGGEDATPTCTATSPMPSSSSRGSLAIKHDEQLLLSAMDTDDQGQGHSGHGFGGHGYSGHGYSGHGGGGSLSRHSTDDIVSAVTVATPPHPTHSTAATTITNSASPVPQQPIVQPEPTILFRYPDNTACPPAEICDFCLPHGTELAIVHEERSDRAREVLLSRYSSRLLLHKGYALWFEDGNNATHHQAAERTYVICITVPSIMLLPVPGEAEGVVRVISSLKSFAFVTRYPYFDLFLPLLQEIAALEKLQVMSALDCGVLTHGGLDLTHDTLSDMLTRLACIEAPTLNNSLSFQLHDSLAMIQFTRLAPLRERWIDEHEMHLFHFCIPSLLLGSLSIDLLCLLLGAMLLEVKVILCSVDSRRLAAAVHGLSLLLKPFKWAGPILPILPAKLMEFLESPVPLIAGLVLRGNTDAEFEGVLSRCRDEHSSLPVVVMQIDVQELWLSGLSTLDELCLPDCKTLRESLLAIIHGEKVTKPTDAMEICIAASGVIASHLMVLCEKAANPPPPPPPPAILLPAAATEVEQVGEVYSQQRRPFDNQPQPVAQQGIDDNDNKGNEEDNEYDSNGYEEEDEEDEEDDEDDDGGDRAARLRELKEYYRQLVAEGDSAAQERERELQLQGDSLLNRVRSYNFMGIFNSSATAGNANSNQHDSNNSGGSNNRNPWLVADAAFGEVLVDSCSDSSGNRADGDDVFLRVFAATQLFNHYQQEQAIASTSDG